MELVDVLAHEIIRVESGELLAQFMSPVSEHAHHRRVGIHDIQVVIAQHEVGGRSIHGRLQARDFVFLAALFGHFRPFQAVADVVSVGVDNGRNVQIEAQRADLDIGAVGQVRWIAENAALVRRIGMEIVDAGADQLFRVEAAVDPAHFVGVLAHQVERGLVDIGNDQIAVDHHHRRHGAVDRASKSIQFIVGSGFGSGPLCLSGCLSVCCVHGFFLLEFIGAQHCGADRVQGLPPGPSVLIFPGLAGKFTHAVDQGAGHGRIMRGLGPVLLVAPAQFGQCRLQLLGPLQVGHDQLQGRQQFLLLFFRRGVGEQRFHVGILFEQPFIESGGQGFALWRQKIEAFAQ